MNIIRGSFQSNLSIQLCLFSEYFLCCNNQKLVLTSCFSFVQSAQELQLCFPKTHFSTNILRKWTCKLARQVDIEIQALTHSGGKTNLTNVFENMVLWFFWHCWCVGALYFNSSIPFGIWIVCPNVTTDGGLSVFSIQIAAG